MSPSISFFLAAENWRALESLGLISSVIKEEKGVFGAKGERDILV